MTMLFKKRAKQVVAAILCICMMAGIMPVGIPAVNASAADDGNVEFPFIGLSGVSNKSLVSTVTYSNTKNTWKFRGESAGVDSTQPGVNSRYHNHYYTSTYGTTVAGLAKDEWVAYELNNIKADEYDVSFDHLVSTTGCEAELYILPASDSWSISDCDSSNYVGIVKCYDATESFITGKNIGKFTAEADGNYIMVLKGNGVTYGENSEVYKCLWLQKMQLISNKPNVNASVGLDNIMVGTKTTLTVELVVGLTKVNITYNDIDVTFGTNGVARFNVADGTIEGIGPGTTTVTVSTKYNGETVSETFNMTVVEDLIYGDKITYNFMLNDVAHQTNMNQLSGSNWSFFAEHQNATLAHRVYHHWFSQYNGLEYSGGAKGEYVAYRFDNIAAGEYEFTAEHLQYLTGGVAEIYMIPFKADWTISDCNSSNYVGYIDCYTDSGEFTVTSSIGTFNAAKDGSYIMAIKHTGLDPSGNGYRCLWIRNMALVPTIPVLSAKLGASGLIVGTSTDLSVGLTVGASTVVDITLDDVDVTFGTDGIASFDRETGKIIGHTAGKTTVIVSTVYQGETVSRVINLNVADYGAEYLEFNFAEHAKYPVKAHPSSLVEYSYGDGFLRYLPSSNDYVWTEIEVTDAGAYNAIIENILYTGGTVIKVHLVPSTVKDIHEAVAADTYLLGEVDTYAVIEDRKGKTGLGTVVIEEPGKYNVVVQGTGRGKVNDYCYTNKFILDGLVESLEFDSSEIEISKDPAKNTTQTHIVSNLLDKWQAQGKNVMTLYRSSDTRIATVDENGKVTAVSVGTAKITGTYAADGRSFSVYGDITVTDKSEPLSATIDIPESLFVKGEYKVDFDVLMESGGVMKALEYGGQADFDVTITPEGAATFDPQTRTLVGVEPGTVTIGATLTFRGKVFDIEPVTVRVTKTSKGKSTIYTDKIREAMLYNAENDLTIKAKARGYINKADKHVERIEDIYNYVVGEGIFRYYFVGHTGDPNKQNCRYCGAYIPDYTDIYGWITDPVNMPWKIQCPACRRKFPSNDFESYYKLGLDAKGNFDHERAKAAHIELFGGLENVGYLKNTEHPEKDEYVNDAGEVVNPGVHGWGVDAGWGYTTKNAKTGLEEHHYYIAFFIHQALWDGNDGSKNDAIPTVLEDLKNAYLYTNDVKYARAGIKILDRIADFYPDYEWYPWHDMRGDSYTGKIVDSTWSNAHARKFTEAYDAFYPAYEDAQVISYLSKKAVEQETADENPKNSAEALRNHVEDNILREIMRSARNQNLSGNFGMTQHAVAAAAVALNSMPETGEWLDWVNAPGESFGVDENPPECTGGNLLPQIMLTVDRDGMGNEGSPSYNNGWVTLLIKLANVLAGYELYPQADLYKNTKFIKMLSANFPLVLAEYYTAQIGDSGSYATNGTTLSKTTLATAYYQTKDPIFAQALYLANRNSAKGLAYDETVLDPSKLADEVEEVIKEYGELDTGSVIMSGYGFSVIRDGDKYPNFNTHRDFWMYYGKNRGHAHRDSLNIGLDAFGLNLSPELGYPTATGQDPEKMQWIQATISHNTVTVNEKTQNDTNTYGSPIHFDDSGKVKLIEAERPIAYSSVDEYRRTVVMIEVDDTVSYGVDFFRVAGGDDHLYSFHAQSESYSDTEGLNLVAAGDPKNTYGGIKKGTYFERGPDPHPQSGIASSADGLTYPAGYTWMDNVESDYKPEKVFAVDFDIDDTHNLIKDNKDIHLRMTMVNDFDLAEVSVVNGYPAKGQGLKNSIKYVLARRKGASLKTLFTTVLEPYKGERYLSRMENLKIVRTDGKDFAEREVAKAIKVVHKSGRVDYVAYSQDNTVDYNIIDGDLVIPFKGFVGVATYEDDDNDGVIAADATPVYTYLHDGAKFAKNEETLPAYTGMILSYTDELSLENYIDVDMDQADVNVEEIAGKVINVKNDGALNGVYRIVDAEKLENGNVRLNIGEVSVIRGYADSKDLAKGFEYNIQPSQTFSIPLSYTSDSAPVLSENSGKYKATAGKHFSFTVNAVSESGKKLTATAVSLPRGASFDSETNTFSWTPSETQLGEYSTAIKVSDGTLNTTYTALITVHRSSGSAGEENNAPSTPTTPPASGGAGASGGGGGGGASGGGSGSGNASGDVSDSQTENEATTPDTDDDEGETPAEKFTDLSGFDWAKEAIYDLVEAGIVNGTSDNTYAPSKNIKRADFAIMLVRAFGITEGEGSNFADVTADKYYAEQLRLAKVAGIVNGIGDNKFGPDSEISRQDMMLMLYRALKAKGYELEDADASALAEFADAASIAEYAQQAVASLVSGGYVAGSNGKVNPLGRATRAEVAVLLGRIFIKK